MSSTSPTRSEVLVRRGAHRQDRGGGGEDLRPHPDPRRQRPHQQGHREARRDGPGERGKRDGGTWPMTAGILRGIEEGWFMSEIAEAAFQYQVALEKGEKKVVGVNCHTESISHELRDPAGQPRGGARAGRPRSASRRTGATRPRSGPRCSTWSRCPAPAEHGPRDARGRAGRGDARRDLRRAARQWGVYREPARF